MVSEVMGYGVLFIVFLLISVNLFVFSFREKTLGHRIFSIFSFLLIVLFFGEVFIIFSPNMFNKLLGIAIANIAYPLITINLLCFALYLSNNEKYIQFKYIFPLSIIPIFSVIGGFINCYIPIFETLTILPNGLIIENWTLLYTYIDYYLMFLAFIILALLLIQLFRDKENWKRYVLFFLSSFFPTIVGYTYGTHESYPIAYFCSLLFFWLAILAFDLISSDVIHKEFIEHANMGMVFFDANNKLVELNDFAKKESGFTEDDLGKYVEEVFVNVPEFIDFYYSDDNEIVILSKRTNHWFKVNKTKLHKKDKLTGYLFIFEDITEETIQSRSLKVLNSVMADVESVTSLAINYQDEEGKYHWSDEAYTILERGPRSSDANTDIFTEVSLETDYDVEKEINQLKQNEVRVKDFKIKTESGKIKYIKGTLHRVHDKDGNFLRLNMSTQDVTEIIEHERAILKSEGEKTVLLKEIHHRVKNNLQLIRSFINLERKFHPDDYERILDTTEDRIDSLALIHERIYNEHDMNYIVINQFLEDFDNNLYILSSDEHINFVSDIPEDLTLAVDMVTPLTLMINELTTNSFKYAFDDSIADKTIYKSFNVFEEDGKTFCRFEYKDNGKGLPEGYDVRTSKSLGWKIILSLSKQLDGEYNIINENGLGFVLTFPIK